MADITEGVPALPGGNGPWWFAGASAVILLGFGAVRLLFKFKSTKHEYDNQVAVDGQALEEKHRKSAIESYAEVINRLDEEIGSLTAKVETLTASHTRCETEAAAAKAILRMVVAWARKQKTPFPFPDDLLGPVMDDSRTHTPLPEERGNGYTAAAPAG